MDISQLIEKIQGGDKSLYGDLWDAVRGFIAWCAKRYYHELTKSGPAPGGVEVDDLIQAGYFAMLEAADRHDPERGTFLNILGFYLKNHFAAAAGLRNKPNPLDRALSLDMPVNADEPDGASRFDSVPDERKPIEEIEDHLYNEELHAALEKAIEKLPAREAEAIRAEYWQGKNLTETASKMGIGVERARQLRNGGLRHIRYGTHHAELEQFLDSETLFYKKVTPDRFNRTHTSAVEEVMLWREKRRNELEKSLCPP